MEDEQAHGVGAGNAERDSSEGQKRGFTQDDS